MPLYHWHCKVCDQHIEVLRSFKEYEDVPNQSELDCDGHKPDCPHEWERQIGQDIRAYRGAGWKGAKGYWLFPLLLSLTSCVTPEQWGPAEHRHMALTCMTMCRKEAKSYEPLTGECTCQVPHGDLK